MTRASTPNIDAGVGLLMVMVLVVFVDLNRFHLENLVSRNKGPFVVETVVVVVGDMVDRFVLLNLVSCFLCEKKISWQDLFQ